MEVQNQEHQNPNSDQVVLLVDQPHSKLKMSPPPQQEDSKLKQSPPPQPPDIKDPLSKTQARTKSLRRLNFSKPKSRFTETTYPPPSKTIAEPEEYQPLHPPGSTTSTDEDDDDEEWFENEEEEEGDVGEGKKHYNYLRKRKRKIKKRALIEFILFLIIMTCLILSLTVESLKKKILWGLVLWKWWLMVLVLFCGRLVSVWVVGFLVFLIERNFMLREKVLYFVFGLRKSFQHCAWLGLVLLAWMSMFHDVHKNNKVLKKVFRALIAVLIGATIWLLKILLVKVLASSFHVATFFDRMKESVFHHYILDTLSGPPLEEDERETPWPRTLRHSKTLPAKLRERGSPGMLLSRSKRYKPRSIDMERLRKLSMTNRPTAWNVKRLVSYIKSSGLSTISRSVDDFGNVESEITSEWEARGNAQRVFRNVAKSGAKYIEEEDLLRFLKSVEVHTIFPLFEGAVETGKITKSSFRNWVVHAYVERKALAHSLNDTKTAVQQLHKLASAIVTVIIIVISLLVTGLATTKVLFVFTSQLLLVGFMFQNTCKTIFESIIFVFVMHPFDVGDRCVIDGVQMIVEEMNILTTVFLRYDSEKIYYPNSVLLTKPISNFRRSPDMGDAIDITIDVSTPVDDFNALKKAIQVYIESKPKHWNPKHSLLVKEIENVNKMKLTLSVVHTMNHQNYGEKSSRRSELVFELKKIFDNLGIKYHLLPRQVHLTHVNMIDNGGMPM
ncbi:mechanosensitive ion channel protein [Salix suchowensis]|nr:mechanosensitive ion channel protein [Salix suchowensis]